MVKQHAHNLLILGSSPRRPTLIRDEKMKLLILIKELYLWWKGITETVYVSQSTIRRYK